MNWIILTITIFSIFLSILAPIEYLIKFTVDDSYFYLKTALNFSKGLGSTFDGLNITNGYHPLWFYILAMVFKITEYIDIFSMESFLRLVFILSILINSLTLIFLKKFYNIYIDKSINNNRFILFILLINPLSLMYLIGLEIQIFLLFFISSLIWLVKFIKDDFSLLDNFILSLNFTAIFLSRVDLFWFYIASIIIYVSRYKKDKLKNLAIVLLLPFFTCLLYVVYNQNNFGYYYPISSLYKFSFSIIQNLRNFPIPEHNPIDFFMFFIIVSSWIVLLWFRNKRINERNDFFNLLLFFNDFFLGFIALHFLFNQQSVREWYYSIPIFVNFLSLNQIKISKKLIVVLIFILLILNVFYFILFRANYYNHNSAYDFAKKVKELVPENSKIYQVDHTGLISFFSERQIINGDGLINSIDYYKAVKDKRLKDYLMELKPDYLIFYSFDPVIKNDTIHYKFRVINKHELKIHKSNIILRHPLLYGGIFRRRIGQFYLVKLNEYKIVSY